MYTTRTGWRRHVACLLLVILGVTVGPTDSYRVGVGRADCTGPSVEITFMGYAQITQRGSGIHLRQYARSFIIEDSDEPESAGQRVVFVSVDAGMMGHAVKRDVLAVLQQKYGALYTHENVVISGTHTHSTPGGFLMYLLYDLTSLGFVSETFNALVHGIAQSVIRAHNNMVEARLYVAETEVMDASVNRSPSAYENNPAEERAQYQHNVDRTLMQLQFVGARDGTVLGAINWFAVHPTSMNNTNRLVSSDNVGLAAVLLEQERNLGALVGKGEFVGAFASSNLGDVSPNIAGPRCEKTGLPCDVLTSSCPSGAGACFASGPGRDMFESTKIIADRLYRAASGLLAGGPTANGAREIHGPVRAVHQYVDMTTAEAIHLDRETGRAERVRGCLPAMGYSFAAGTTDGPGAFDFQQGTVTDNVLWNAVRDFIAEPTQDDKECQAPKPILLATGRARFPYDWQPKVVPTQLLLVGDLAIAAVPGEFTTMAGRRLRNAVGRASVTAGGPELQVVVAGLSNMYSSYITTPEEYEVQRYEGASTLYGPHTLTIYLEQYRKLVRALTAGNETLPAGPTPPYEDDKQISLTTGVIFDSHPLGKDFGDVKVQPVDEYQRGDTVSAVFIAGNPRNNLMHDKSFFTVERQSEDDWAVVATDANWETRFRWERTSTILGFSDIEFSWTIASTTLAGTYRIRHFGYYRYILGGIYPYVGTTNSFIVM